MAYNTAAFSPKEWTLGIKEEETVGTAVTSYDGIEIESISFPSINDGLRVTEKRSGSTGPVLNTNDLVYAEAGGIHEISVSGVLNKTLLPVLVENATGIETSTNNVIVNHNYAPAHFLHGAESSGAHNTVAFCIEGPAGGPNDSYTLKGCVITSLTFNAESATEGGRIKFDLTAQTRTPMTTTAVAQSVNTIAAPAETYLTLGHGTAATRVFAKECILDSLGFTIENPVTFLGNGAITGAPEAYQRSYPEMNITANCSVKYDANSATFVNDWRTQGIATKTDTGVVDDGVAGFYFANDATWADATTFGIKMDNVMIAEQPTLNEGDYMKVDCVLKAVNDELTTSDILDIRVS